MSSIVQWGTPQAPHGALFVTSALTNNSRQLGGMITPSGYMYASWEWNGNFHVSPTAGGSIDLYTIPTIDDTNYETGDAGVDGPATTYIGSFPLIMINNSGQRIPIINVPTIPMNFKPLIKNSSGQTVPANSGTLTVRFYNEIVG